MERAGRKGREGLLGPVVDRGERRKRKALKREEKEEFVGWMNQALREVPSVVMADYRGLTVAKMNELRGECRKAEVKFKVVKNTLTKRACADTPMEVLAQHLEGPTALAWHGEDPGAPAKVLTEFAKRKGNEALEIKGGVSGGRYLTRQEVEQVLATLPSRDELLSQMAFLFAEVGARRMYRLLGAGPSKLYRSMLSLKQARAGE